MVAFEGVWLPQSIIHIGTKPMLFFIKKILVDFMKTIERDWLEKIAEKDLRYLDNKDWLEEMNLQFKIGDPAIIWFEAMMLAEAMWNTVFGRDKVFIRWGHGMNEKKLFVVRKMAIYLIENPSDFRKYTEIDELDKMKEIAYEQEIKIRTKIKENKGSYDFWLNNDIVASKVAECICMDFVKRKALKITLRELMGYSKYFSLNVLTIFHSLVTAYNNDLGGWLQEEEEEIFLLISERRKINKMESEMIEFTDEQLKKCGIRRDRRSWMEAMYMMSNGEYRVESEYSISDEDLCTGFLAALKWNGEFNDYGDYDRFFGIMASMMKMEIDLKNRNNIIRYIQDCTPNFKEWNTNSVRRRVRKKIAMDLENFKNEIKKKRFV